MIENRSHPIISYLYDTISNIPRDRRVTTELEINGRLFISALIQRNKNYEDYKLPNTEEEVNTYWLDDKYDEIEDTRILSHYKSDIKLVYDNGIRSVDYDGNSTYEEDVEDSLYIKVDSVSILERQFNTINKIAEHITPHVDAVTVDICNNVQSNGTTEVIDSRVIGYKVTDVDTVVSPMQSDWKSYQLIGNLLKYENNV